MGNGRLRKFGPEAPLWESMETVPNLRDQKRCVEMGSVNVELPWQLPIIRGIHYLKILCKECH
jgi:hypothetical protein